MVGIKNDIFDKKVFKEGQAIKVVPKFECPYKGTQEYIITKVSERELELIYFDKNRFDPSISFRTLNIKSILYNLYSIEIFYSDLQKNSASKLANTENNLLK